MRKKICFFIGYYPLVKGGAEYQSRLIADSLQKKYEVFFISVSNNHISKEMIVQDGYRIYQLNYNLNYNKLFLYYPLAKSINRILEKEQPDFIYQRILNSFSYHLSNYAFKFNVKHIIHIADKYSLLFEDNSISSKIRKYMFANLKLEQTKFITQNIEQTDLLALHKRQPILQVYNMHPVPSLDFPSIENFKINSLIKKIVWIGSSRAVKRLELFIEIANYFIDTPEVKFYIIGRIENNSYGDKLMIAINNSINIEYLGEQENNFVNNFLEKEAYLTVNTSLSEGFSNVFIQSWLRGVPVFSLNSNPDHLFDKYRLGFYFKNNENDLKEQLKDIISNVKLYSELSSESYKLSRDLFSLEKSIKKIEQIL